MTRAQISEVGLKTLWNRRRLTGAFMDEASDWLLTGGWALIDGGSTYAAVKVEALLNWPSVSPKRISEDVALVIAGDFDFGTLERLIPSSYQSSGIGDQAIADDDGSDN
jgi:hypothetical protein